MLERIRSTVDIGKAVRKKRKEDGLTLAEASALCGVGYRFLSNLENGKATAEVGKTLQVLSALPEGVGDGSEGCPMREKALKRKLDVYLRDDLVGRLLARRAAPLRLSI